MDALSLICTRRSTRNYKDQPVSKELLEQILEAGRYAPSGGNNQTTHFLVIQNKALLSELAVTVKEEFSKMEVTPGMYPSLAAAIRASKGPRYIFHYQAPVLIVTANKMNYGNNMADCACALENMMIMANALNLGTCWINQLKWLNENPAVVPILKKHGLEDDEIVLGAISVGWPATPSGEPNRKMEPRKGNPVTWIC